MNTDVVARKRAGLRALLRRLMRRGIDYVVIERIDRLSRSVADHVLLTELITRRGADLVTAQRCDPLRTPSRDLVRRLRTAFGDFEKGAT